MNYSAFHAVSSLNIELVLQDRLRDQSHCWCNCKAVSLKILVFFIYIIAFYLGMENMYVVKCFLLGSSTFYIDIVQILPVKRKNENQEE